MSAFLTGFGTGLANQLNENITKRGDEAKAYFDEQMKVARERAYKFRTEGQAKYKASLQVANQMKAAGVPEHVVMAIANQNPDDLPEFYATIQEMQLKGVDTTSPEFYDELIKVDSEFNPGNENVTSLLKKIHMPLAANANADPEGFKLDPRGNIWATMMGYDAMERAQEKLETTVLADGRTAADFIYSDGLPSSPLGPAAATLNAPFAGDAMRRASDDGELTPNQQLQFINTFQDWVKDEKVSLANEVGGTMTLEEIDAEAGRRAAQKMVDNFPFTIGMPQISRWLTTEGDDPLAAQESVTEVPLEDTPPESPPEAPTAPTMEEATPTPPDTEEAPSELPDGSTLEKDLGNGFVVYKDAQGGLHRYTKSYVQKIVAGQRIMQEKPKPGWLEELGSEYD